MPKDYIACRDAMTKEGKSLKEAQRVCAIQYYKKHGKALPRDAKSGLSAEEVPVNAEEHPMDTADAALVLDWLYNEISAKRKTSPEEDMTTMMKKYMKNKKMKDMNKGKKGHQMMEQGKY